MELKDFWASSKLPLPKNVLTDDKHLVTTKIFVMIKVLVWHMSPVSQAKCLFVNQFVSIWCSSTGFHKDIIKFIILVKRGKQGHIQKIPKTLEHISWRK